MLIYLVFLIVCFGASIVGAICGIGGGVIIKPVLDSFGVLDVTAISFLSGCTVLSMTTYSVLKNKISGESHVTMFQRLIRSRCMDQYIGKCIMAAGYRVENGCFPM